MAKKKRQSAAPAATACALSDRDLVRALDDQIANIPAIDAVPELLERNAPGSASVLRAHLASAINDSVRASCAAALGAKKTAANCKALVAALQDPSPEVVRRASQSLGRIGGQGELKNLRKLRPTQPAVRRTVEAAKTLLCYRLGEKRGLLQAPPETDLLHLAQQKSRPIAVETVSLEASGLNVHLPSNITEIRLSDTALQVVCDRWGYLAVFSRDLFRAGAAAFARQPGVLGILLRKEQVDNLYYRYAYLLARPEARNRIAVCAMRGTTELAWYGSLNLADGLHFNMQALNTRHTRPLEFTGTLDIKAKAFTNIDARVAVDKAPTQPSQRQPRRLRPAVRPGLPT